MEARGDSRSCGLRASSLVIVGLTMASPPAILFFFFFNDTATTEIYTLSLHDALPISAQLGPGGIKHVCGLQHDCCGRSEEHTSELQSQSNLVCRLLLEKKKTQTKNSSSCRTGAWGRGEQQD